MARRALFVGLFHACAIALIVGVGVLLAPSRHPEASASTDSDASSPHVTGRGASVGILHTHLHSLHLNGDEPVTCVRCHTIRPEGFSRPDRERCLTCHPERSAALHQDVKDDKPRQCVNCHDFLTTDDSRETPWKCAACHEKPHDGQMAVVGVTLSVTCGRCHSPHGVKADAPKACTTCHEDKVNEHRADPDPTTRSCLACHRQHDSKKNAIGRCAPCHQSGEPSVPRIPTTATFAGGHEQCIGCHEPHVFSKKTVKACTTCHAGQKALAADRVTAHANCRNCHDQHAVKEVSGEKTCRRCHSKLLPSHPHSDRGDTCLGCHPAHPDTKQVARACSSCHKIAGDDRAFHRGARCRDCHREHAFKLQLQPQFCLGCHSGRVGQRAPVSTNQGHRDCTSCHGNNPHDPAKPPACGNCHKNEASTAPKGHATCLNCHEQHSGQRKPKAQDCTNCHTDRRGGVHQNVKGGCQTCHRPHGPGGVAGPPQCTSCHDRRALPNLHQVPQHGTCTSCHHSHSQPWKSPATCRSCHKDQQDHEPTATNCTGCHQFRKEPQ